MANKGTSSIDKTLKMSTKQTKDNPDITIIRDMGFVIKNKWDSKTPAKSTAELRKMIVDLEKQDVD